MLDFKSKMRLVHGVQETLKSIKGVAGVFQMNRDDLEKILQLENDGNPFLMTTRTLNEGVSEVAKREIAFAVVKTKEFPRSAKPTVVLIYNEKIVGEEVVNSKILEELKPNPNVVLLGEEFAIYRDRVQKLQGKESIFMYPALPFPMLDNLIQVEDVVSASPGPLTDLYIKERGGWDPADSRLGTILVGFNVKELD